MVVPTPLLLRSEDSLQLSLSGSIDRRGIEGSSNMLLRAQVLTAISRMVYMVIISWPKAHRTQENWQLMIEPGSQWSAWSISCSSS